MGIEKMIEDDGWKWWDLMDNEVFEEIVDIMAIWSSGWW